MQEENYLKRIYERLVLGRPKGKEKWYHVTA